MLNPVSTPVSGPTPAESRLREIAEDATRLLVQAHPAIAADVVAAVVFQAAGELAGSSRGVEEFHQLLRRRADARLRAMAGVFTPIRAR
ncbi:hypothetical protein [Actinokineospora inagensis]|uniref:hypothetical protein n=1 Tax=Actinokineospora inagensis TaxID=103730 RepID=UPI0012FBE667|nr:hypothetical protein [Actinokineospora inagensis]